MTNNNNQDSIELACVLDAIPASEREAHIARAQQLVLHSYLETIELEDGIAFKFPVDEFENIVTYIRNERHCCAFFTFDLKISSHHGPIWLHIHGNEQIKNFLKNELQSVPHQDVI